jgi:hypothetical protein
MSSLASVVTGMMVGFCKGRSSAGNGADLLTLLRAALLSH